MKRHRSSSHAATLPFNEKRLPKWAKLIPPRIQSDPGIVGRCTGKSQRTGIQSSDLCDPNDLLEKQNEDEYLRSLAYHSIALFLENHLQKVLQNSCSTMIHEILELRVSTRTPSIDVNFTPNDVNNEQTATSSLKDKTTESISIPGIINGDSDTHGEGTETSPPASEPVTVDTDSLVRKYTVRNNVVYDPLLLPVYLLDNGPFSMADKSLITSYVLRQIQKAEPRTCCISLPSSDYHPLHHGYHKCNVSYKEDFMNQCWNQEVNQLLCHNNDLSRKKGISRQLKKIRASLSITDQLVLWASQTIYFDSIIIFWNIEHASVMYNHHSNMLNSGKQSFEQFMHWCAERRAVHGVPISVALYNPSNGYRQSVPFYSSIQSMIGIRLHNITTTPDTTAMVSQFWKNVISDIARENNPSAILVYSVCQSNATDVFSIFGTFQHQDQSITRFIRSIQELISKYLSSPSNLKTFPSTIAVLCHCHIRSTNLLNRITSLLYDGGFLKYLLNPELSLHKTEVKNGSRLFFHEIEEYEMRCVLLSNALQIYGAVWDKYGEGTNHHREHPTSMKAKSLLPFLLFDNQLCSLRFDSKLDSILLKDEDRQVLLKLLFKYRMSVPCNHGPISTSIDVSSEPRNRSESALVERMHRTVNEMIVLFDHCISLQDVLRCVESSLMEILPIDGNVSYSTPLPRRDYVHALLDNSKITHGAKSASLISIPGWLYEIVRNRISITEVEWYQAFCLRYLDEIGIAPTAAKIFSLFACGIRHLQVSGLIRRSIGKNSIVQYERTGLVWCGGD
jgi:hypothetical protein